MLDNIVLQQSFGLVTTLLLNCLQCSKREDLLVRIGQMKSELAFQMNKLQHQKDVSDNCKKAKEEKSELHSKCSQCY